jgi:predicted anti-sigma-YlaC factor YlaD
MNLSKPYCDKLRRQFDDYRDGELSPFLKAVVAKHLRSCEACRREYAFVETVVATVRKKPAPDIPPRLVKKLIRDLTAGGRGGTPVPKTDPKLLEGLQGTT